MHCPSLRGTSEAEGVIVNVIVNVIVRKRVNVIVIVIVRKRVIVIVNVNVEKSTCMYRAWCMHVLFLLHVCNVMGLLLYSDNSE